MKNMMTSDTIAAIATALTNSGIGIIRVSGNEAFDIVDRIFRPKNKRKKLKEETKGAITLIVAQRVTSIMDATKIIVLNERVVVGMGTHRELLKSCSIYHEIATSQLSEEELAQ